MGKLFSFQPYAYTPIKYEIALPNYSIVNLSDKIIQRRVVHFVTVG